MNDLRKAAADLLEVVEAAIKAGDWKVDGACDLDLAIVRLRQALEQPEQEPVEKTWVGLTKDEVDSWELPDCPTVFEFAQFVEAKLKEKNNG